MVFYSPSYQVGGQAVLGRQNILPTPWLTERHGYDPTFRVTWERSPESHRVFAYRIFTFYDALFQALQLTLWFFTLRPICNSDRKRPTTPLLQRLHPLM